MSFVDKIQAIQGVEGPVAVGPPGVVGVLPDDELREEFREGIFGFVIFAGGAGLRSEFAAFNFARTLTRAYELSELEINVPAGTSVELAAPTGGFSGFTAGPHYWSEFDAITGGVSVLRIEDELRFSSKNSAAATAATAIATFSMPTTDIWVRVPGRIILRSSNSAGGQILVRPTADNVGIRIKGRWRLLERRKL